MNSCCDVAIGGKAGSIFGDGRKKGVSGIVRLLIGIGLVEALKSDERGEVLLLRCEAGDGVFRRAHGGNCNRKHMKQATLRPKGEGYRFSGLMRFGAVSAGAHQPCPLRGRVPTPL